eukprot:Nitzschia sp. Nitz4//scaffold329_size19327//3206//6550//NITZ4_008726-RA/size19327-snap-gene-0.0-mRNA-1//1//CDS//3329547990//6521//frame0
MQPIIDLCDSSTSSSTTSSNSSTEETMKGDSCPPVKEETPAFVDLCVDTDTDRGGDDDDDDDDDDNDDNDSILDPDDEIDTDTTRRSATTHTQPKVPATSVSPFEMDNANDNNDDDDDFDSSDDELLQPTPKPIHRVSTSVGTTASSAVSTTAASTTGVAPPTPKKKYTTIRHHLILNSLPVSMDTTTNNTTNNNNNNNNNTRTNGTTSKRPRSVSSDGGANSKHKTMDPPPRTSSTKKESSQKLPAAPPVLRPSTMLCIHRHKVLQKNGLPREQLYLAAPNGLVYRIALHAALSNIPNAGYGAFMTLVAVYHTWSLPQPRKPWKVRIAGLGGKYQNAPTLQATSYPSSRGDNQHHGSSSSSSSSQVFPLPEWKEIPSATFSSSDKHCGVIDLGKYGAYREEDRKIDLHFQIKSFLYQFCPGEWSFDVDEKLMTRMDQILDFTDDLTGEPHTMACENIPKYVNEVGYAKEMDQNVVAEQVQKRNVHYYADIQRPLRQGETVELLVNYGETYEPTRERQGYGRNNLLQKVQSDSHGPSRLERNLVERRDVVADIRETPLFDFYLLVGFCRAICHKLKCLVLKRLMVKVDTSKTSPVSALQLVALRRMCWLSTVLRSRLEVLKTEVEGADFMIQQCKEWIDAMNWKMWSSVWGILDKNKDWKDHLGKSLYSELLFEAVEEISYEANIVAPMQDSRWCPMAKELTQNLCSSAARCLWSARDTGCLLEEFVQSMKGAMLCLTNPARLDMLVFEKEFQDHFACQTPTKTAAVVVTPPDSQIGDAGLSGLRSVCVSQTEYVPNVQSKQLVWYLCRQVLVLVDAVASWSLGSTYSRTNIVDILGLSPQDVELSFKHPIRPYANATQATDALERRRGRGRRSPYPPKIVKSYANENGANVKSLLFWKVVWATLQDECGWTLERGERASDFYAHPPGVQRFAGFRNRIDFFDSVPLVLNCLRNHPQWSVNPVVVNALKLHEALLVHWNKNKRQVPKGTSKQEQLTWLLEHYHKQSDSSRQ